MHQSLIHLCVQKELCANYCLHAHGNSSNLCSGSSVSFESEVNLKLEVPLLGLFFKTLFEHFSAHCRFNFVFVLYFIAFFLGSKLVSFFNGSGVVLASILGFLSTRFSHLVYVCGNHKN